MFDVCVLGGLFCALLFVELRFYETHVRSLHRLADTSQLHGQQIYFPRYTHLQTKDDEWCDHIMNTNPVNVDWTSGVHEDIGATPYLKIVSLRSLTYACQNYIPRIFF